MEQEQVRGMELGQVRGMEQVLGEQLLELGGVLLLEHGELLGHGVLLEHDEQELDELPLGHGQQRDHGVACVQQSVQRVHDQA